MKEPKKLYCEGCGIEIDPELDQMVLADEQPFCIWCWSNDCCRVSRDAADAKQKVTAQLHLTCARSGKKIS